MRHRTATLPSRPGRPLTLLALFLVACVAVASCSSGGKKAATPSPSASTTPSAAATATQLTSGSTKTAALAVQTPTTTCAALAKQDFSQIAGGTKITSATAVAKTGTSYAYCDVKGTVAPSIGFELLLPTATYRQRYLQEGCEGLCGMTMASTSPAVSTGCTPVTDGSFVIGQDDEGHASAGFGGTVETWAASSQLRIDFGYRSEGAFATAAKAIVKGFYGAAPKYSYYDGCSDGGREALMVAQRYPTMFNGVLAGAPAFNQTALNEFEEAYLATVDFRADGSTIMPATKLTALHAAVIKKCADPALHDDTIQDSRTCDFDPASIQCPGSTSTASCLTVEEVAVVKKIYTGVVDPNGTHLYTGGMPYGSELIWSGLVIPAAGQPQSSLQLYGIGLSFRDYLAGTKPDPSAKITAALFTVANLKAALNDTAKIYDATNPDLSAFYKAGGKLILWHGAADQNIPPAGTIAYRQAVIDKMGQSTVDEFLRFYLFPGVYHCGNGTGPDEFNLLSPLLAWTETGTAPGAVIASKTTGGSSTAGPSGGQLGGGTGGPPNGGQAPSGAGFAGPSGAAPAGATTSAAPVTVLYTRPVYPYPQRVKYSGAGSVKVAASYVPYTPTATDDHFEWAGTFLST